MLAARVRANDVVSRATMRHADNWLLWRLTAEYRLYRNYRDLCDSRPDEPIVVPRTELFSAIYSLKTYWTKNELFDSEATRIAKEYRNILLIRK